jgi:hypothetical protein
MGTRSKRLEASYMEVAAAAAAALQPRKTTKKNHTTPLSVRTPWLCGCSSGSRFAPIISTLRGSRDPHVAAATAAAEAAEAEAAVAREEEEALHHTQRSKHTRMSASTIITASLVRTLRVTPYSTSELAELATRISAAGNQ